MTASVAAERNKLSRRKKARAKQTLHKAFAGVLTEIDRDQFLRSHLFLNKPAKDKLVVGGYIVTKQEHEVYNVYKKNLNNLLHKDLYSFDAAMAIAESLNAGHDDRVQEIINEEQRYADAYNDIMSFKYQHKYAIENNTGNAGVFEDRYVLACEKARKALKAIKRFRIARR